MDYSAALRDARARHVTRYATRYALRAINHQSSTTRLKRMLGRSDGLAVEFLLQEEPCVGLQPK